jgi:hypothetical protein
MPPHDVSLRSILILSTHLCLGLPNGLVPSGFFHQYPICTPLFPRSCYMPCPSHPPWLDHLAKSTSYEVLHYAVFSNLISLHLSLVQIFSSTPCSQTPSVSVLPLTWETKFRCPQNYRQNYNLGCFNIYVFGRQTTRQGFLNWMIALNFLWIKFWFVTFLPKYFKFALFSKFLCAIFMLWFCPAFWRQDSNIYLVFCAYIKCNLLPSVNYDLNDPFRKSIYFLTYLRYM